MALANNGPQSILLADDDSDDTLLFGHALTDVCKETKLIVVENGQQLMDMLHAFVPPYPNAIFLDLNMPRKNGIECLEEIKSTEKLKTIPILVYSTTAQEQSVLSTYRLGANYYIQKPATYNELKGLIKRVLSINWYEEKGQTAMENFILRPDNDQHAG